MDSRKMKRNVCTSRLMFRSAGITLIGLGAFLAIFWPHIFDRILAGELTLGPQSKAFEQWKSPSVPLYLDVYFFNWTNSDDFLDETTKPIMKEIGPYRFREHRDKKNITFDDKNSTVSYRIISTFFFDEEGSNGTLDDVITQLNIVAVGASALAIGLDDYQKRKLISMGLNAYEQKIAVSKTARELLFEGYEDNMVLMGREGLIEGFNIHDNPYDRIGWLYLRNATDKLSGTYNMHTGLNEIFKLGTIQNFNYLNNNKHYSGECSKIHGSTGELFPPKQTRDSVNLFTPDMCRTIPFDYEKDVEIHGVTGYRFSGGIRALDNGTRFPENECYNSGEVVNSGVMNISACRYGSPVFMSFPHYFAADEFYLNEVDGMEPSKEKHESYFTLEPLTGAPLEVTIRFQANLLVRPIDDISLFQDVPRVFMPAMWFEQKFVMDEEMAQQIKVAVKIPVIGQIAGLVIFGVGIILAATSYLMEWLQTRRNSIRQKMEFNLGDNKSETGQKKEVSPLLSRKVRPQIVQQKRQASAK